MAISLSQYTAANNHREANRLVKLWGLSNPRNEKELVHSLDYLLIHGREEFLNDLAKIHPDKDLILKANSTEIKSNCGGGFSNIVDENPNANQEPKKESQTQASEENKIAKSDESKDDKVTYIAFGIVAAIAMGILLKTH
jgi:hypothetical protein